jgi:hypothetical protein
MEELNLQVLKMKLRNIFLHQLGVTWTPEQIQYFENNLDGLIEIHLRKMNMIQKT